MLAAAFAIVALLLAGVGVYGVIAYTVGARRREFGIRLALGALPGQIGRLVLADGLRLAGIGLGLGLVASLAAARLLQSQLYETAPHDPAAYLAAAGALGCAALLACWLPVRRAAAADPQVVLRDE